MRNFVLGVTVGTILTTMVVHASGKDGIGGSGRPPLLNDERERQFPLQLEHMRQQTELEQARMLEKRSSASEPPSNLARPIIVSSF